MGRHMTVFGVAGDLSRRRFVSGPGVKENRFFPVLGNHDWDAPGEGCKPYLDYFTLPGNERYYEFVWGPVHFFMLDNDGHEPDRARPGGRQHEWFIKGVEATPSPIQVAVAHHPPYSSGEHGPIKGADWDFEKHGVDLMLAGHDHNYERIQQDGITYVVNGAGGGDARGRCRGCGLLHRKACGSAAGFRLFLGVACPPRPGVVTRSAFPRGARPCSGSVQPSS